MIGNYAGRILNPVEKLKIFFERLEMSRAFNRNESNPEKMMLLSTGKVIGLLSSTKKVDIKATISTETTQRITLGDQAYGQLELHMEQLEGIFRMFCAWGDHMNNRRLNSSKFLRLLSAAGLLTKDMDCYLENKILLSDANLIYVAVTHVKTKTSNKAPCFRPKSYLSPKDNDFSKMNFQQFLRALEIISTKLYIDVSADQAFISVIENNILSIDCSNSTNNYLKGLLSLVKDPNLTNVIDNIHTTLSPYIRLYLDKKRRLDFPNFIKFCTDFSIFPDIIAKARLTPIFYFMADIYTKNNLALSGTQSLGKNLQALNDIQDPEFIDVEIFVDLVAMAAIEGNQMDKGPVENILLALEKIAQSRGPSLVPLRTGMPRSSELHKSDFLVSVQKEAAKPTPVMSFRELLAGRFENDI